MYFPDKRVVEQRKERLFKDVNHLLNTENELEVSKARHKYDVLHFVVNSLLCVKALMKRIKAFVKWTL
jgi:hypothetical protein